MRSWISSIIYLFHILMFFLLVHDSSHLLEVHPGTSKSMSLVFMNVIIHIYRIFILTLLIINYYFLNWVILVLFLFHFYIHKIRYKLFIFIVYFFLDYYLFIFIYFLIGINKIYFATIKYLLWIILDFIDLLNILSV